MSRLRAALVAATVTLVACTGAPEQVGPPPAPSPLPAPGDSSVEEAPPSGAASPDPTASVPADSALARVSEVLPDFLCRGTYSDDEVEVVSCEHSRSEDSYNLPVGTFDAAFGADGDLHGMVLRFDAVYNPGIEENWPLMQQLPQVAANAADAAFFAFVPVGQGGVSFRDEGLVLDEWGQVGMTGSSGALSQEFGSATWYAAADGALDLPPEATFATRDPDAVIERLGLECESAWNCAVPDADRPAHVSFGTELGVPQLDVFMESGPDDEPEGGVGESAAALVAPLLSAEAADEALARAEQLPPSSFGDQRYAVAGLQVVVGVSHWSATPLDALWETTPPTDADIATADRIAAAFEGARSEDELRTALGGLVSEKTAPPGTLAPVGALLTPVWHSVDPFAGEWSVEWWAAEAVVVATLSNGVVTSLVSGSY